MRHHTKRCADRSNRCRDIVIFKFLECRPTPSRISSNLKIVTGQIVTRAELRHRAKFRCNCWNCGRDMAIFRFLKMAAAAMLDFWNYKSSNCETHHSVRKVPESQWLHQDPSHLQSRDFRVVHLGLDCRLDLAVHPGLDCLAVLAGRLHQHAHLTRRFSLSLLTCQSRLAIRTCEHSQQTRSPSRIHVILRDVHLYNNNNSSN